MEEAAHLQTNLHFIGLLFIYSIGIIAKWQILMIKIITMRHCTHEVLARWTLIRKPT